MKKFIKTLIVLWLVFYCQQVLADVQKSLRIVSLAPANTEILFALGLDKEIVGVSSYCNFPPDALTKEKIGDFSNPNIEKIISLRPDLIFAAGLEQNETVKKLRTLGLKVIVIDPKNLRELFEDINLIGKLTGKKEQARSLIRLMQNRIDKVKQKINSFKYHPKIFIEINSNPLMTASDGSFLDEMIQIAGGINILGNLSRPYCRVSEELVIHQNPDIIIVTHSPDRVDIGKRPGWENIPAVKNDKVYTDINPDILVRPGPRLVEGLEELVKRMYGNIGVRVKGQGVRDKK